MMQARYGWTDDYILSLPFARFKEIATVMGQALADEEKRNLQRASFSAWLVLSGFGMEMTYGEYLGNLGLNDNREGDAAMSPENSLHGTEDVTKEEALAIANRVVQHFRDFGYVKALIEAS